MSSLFACLLSFCLGRNHYLEIGIVARGRNRCLGIESLTISGDGIVNDIGRGGGGNWDKIVVVLDWYYRHFPDSDVSVKIFIKIFIEIFIFIRKNIFIKNIYRNIYIYKKFYFEIFGSPARFIVTRGFEFISMVKNIYKKYLYKYFYL